MSNLKFALTSVFAVALVACTGAKDQSAPASAPPVAGGSAADTTIAAQGGTGLPAGYLARTDDSTQLISNAKYVNGAEGWDITTGPAHILYRPADTASGSYTVTTTIDQLANPAHPEAYGLFIGGTDLAGPNQSYLYFLVRGDGQMLAKRRNADGTVGLIAWQKSKFVPVADSTGHASYKLGIQVTADRVNFLVGSQEVAYLSKGSLPTSGVFGLRINHNLHVHASPVTITRP